MKTILIIRNILKEFKENELIIANILYKEKLSDLISKNVYYETLQKMCESGELMMISEGVYHLPKTSKYGIIPPSEKDIITAFTKNETGTVVGYSLYNKLGLTTQVPKTIIVMSSVLEEPIITIHNIVIQRASLEFSKEVVNMIQGLEVLQNLNSIQDMDYSAFLKYIRELALSFNAEAFKKAISTQQYKESTVLALYNILEYYQIENNLSEYLHP